MANYERIFDEVKEIILEDYPNIRRGEATRKGRTPKKITKVSRDEVLTEQNKLKTVHELDERFHSLLLAESITISELDTRYKTNDYSFYDVISFSLANNLTKTVKRAEILAEILTAYKTNPIEYFIKCLNSKTDNEIPLLEKVT